IAVAAARSPIDENMLVPTTSNRVRFAQTETLGYLGCHQAIQVPRNFVFVPASTILAIPRAEQDTMLSALARIFSPGASTPSWRTTWVGSYARITATAQRPLRRSAPP